MTRLRIGPKRPLRVFLSEHREAQKPPLTLERLGQRFHPPVEKGQISKWEASARKGQISTAVVAEYAEALGLDDPRMLYYPPGKPSLETVASEIMGILKATQSRKTG